MSPNTNQLAAPTLEISRWPLGEQEEIAGSISLLSNDELQDLTRRARVLLSSTNLCRFSLGDLLLYVKLRMSGEFLRWVKTQVGLEPRHAQLLMSASSFFVTERETVSHLPASVLFALAARKRSDLVSKVLEKRAEGIHVTAAMVRTWARSDTNADNYHQRFLWVLRRELAKISPERRAIFVEDAQAIGAQGLHRIANLLATFDHPDPGGDDA